jgi:hypothetical protein
MTSNFHLFGSAVRRRFAEMTANGPLFTVTENSDALWQLYLASFPVGSNPIFRVRTEHDCSCCRHFVKNIGGVVAIENGALTSVWDLNGLPEPYQIVADHMAAAVKSLPIHEPFLTRFATFGAEATHEERPEGVWTWNHFSAAVPANFRSADPQIGLGHARTTHAVFMRGLRELTLEATETVIELIEAGNLYRGEEHLPKLQEFRELQRRAIDANEEQLQLLCWSHLHSPAARFRNSVIGTLVDDLSQGVDLDRAVRSFETKVAPANYKRPKALITQRMVDEASAKVAELGIEPALHRRHARIEDVSVNSVLFVDRAVRPRMQGGIAGILASEVKATTPNLSHATEIGIEDFVRDILPQTAELELFLENRHQGNFVSLTAPVHADAPPIFQWPNNFAWSYDGNVTDSIKERVKRAGGLVEGVDLRVSLAWHNYDDLDLHCVVPDGEHIFFRYKAGILDVDMNAGGGTTREPVENMRWRRPEDGKYRFWVNQYYRRESIDTGFEVELEAFGEVFTISSPKSPTNDQLIGTVTVANGQATFVFDPSLKVGAASNEKWGLRTQELVRVNSLVLSPNHWERSIGNKHYFFLLEGCRNPDPVRGFYNEFLSSALAPHRKVFEVLGDKMKAPFAPEQLSGVGFSSTQRNKVTVVAMGPSLNKPFTIVF